MVLKQINKIHKFGIFQDFNWGDEIPVFGLFNLAYGWNYSGKTTLSRVLRSFESGIKYPDYPDSIIVIEDVDGNIYSQDNLPTKFPIRVFNTDFISENLRWNENSDGIEPILLLGHENIQLQSELERQKENLLSVQAAITQKKGDKKTAEDKLYTALTNKARELKNSFSIPNYSKTHFEPRVQTIAAETGRQPLLEEEVNKLNAIYRSTDKRDIIAKIDCKLPKISEIQRNADILLGTTVRATVIEKLKNNPELNEWVKTGRQIHLHSSVCEFCGNNLPIGLLDKIGNHFSKEYDSLIQNIQNQIANLEKQKVILDLLDVANFYQEFQEEYKMKKHSIWKELQELNKTIQQVISKLNEKKVRAFDKLAFGAIIDNTQIISGLISAVNALIEKHNAKTTLFEQQRSEAFEKLIENAALEFVLAEKYTDTQIQITSLQAEIEKALKDIPPLEAKIIGLEEQLSETVKGAQKINGYLSQYFGKEDIIVKVTGDKKFQLLRNGRIAKNLSEGEKTAIAFAYFITALEDKNTTLQDTVIYVDDPVSSLDSNHLFNTYSFIKSKFYEYDKESKKHKCKAAQFFISTHNFEFFNLIKDWFRDMKKNDKSLYLIDRTTNTDKDESSITTLPKELLLFKSEYTYLFSTIVKFKESPTGSFDHLYNLPNIIRRFIETFTAFKYLSSRNIEENINRLITDPVKCELVRKFVHYHSHSLSTNRFMQFSDLNECSTVVNILLESVKSVDLEHYNSLIEETAMSVEQDSAVIAI